MKTVFKFNRDTMAFNEHIIVFNHASPGPMQLQLQLQLQFNNKKCNRSILFFSMCSFDNLQIG